MSGGVGSEEWRAGGEGEGIESKTNAHRQRDCSRKKEAERQDLPEIYRFYGYKIKGGFDPIMEWKDTF